MSRRLPIVAIVGRPNTGKSTLFNRLVGKRTALVHDKPGMTRDRHYGEAVYQNKHFVVIDTGGYEDHQNSPMLALMREQTLIAIEEADVVIFLAELLIHNDPIDAEILQRLRSSGKKFFLAVNKADDLVRQNQVYSDFSQYGLDQVFPVTALHGDGVFDLLDNVTADFEPGEKKQEDGTGPIKVAVVGRVNVGKSTLVNRLLGKNRVIASDIPGTTRDAIDTHLTVDGEEFILIDTAGIRRRGKIEYGAETLSVHSSFSAIERCDVALMMIDANEGITAQDTHVAGFVNDAGRACVLVLNKWDEVKDKQEKYGELIQKVREDFAFLKWAPIITISAKTGQRASNIWDLIRKCAFNYRMRYPTVQLNALLKQFTTYLSPPVSRNKQLTLKYVTQTDICPPTFTFFVNDPKMVHFSYERFLQNQYRAALGLEGTPLAFKYKKKAIEKGWMKTERDAARGGPPTPEVKSKKLAGGVQMIEIGADDDYEAGVYGDES